MQAVVSLLFKVIAFIYNNVRVYINFLYTWVLFYINNIHFSGFKSNGIPFVMVARGGKCTISSGFKMNNGLLGNPIGRPQPCVIFVDKNAALSIGKNVGISSTAIIAHDRITIGDNVKIGGGACIYDTDFHSINADDRLTNRDVSNRKKSPVHIHDNVFIGAHVTILKGVNIGENSVIGACSLVAKSIPANEVWAGNPAVYIKSL